MCAKAILVAKLSRFGTESLKHAVVANKILQGAVANQILALISDPARISRRRLGFDFDSLFRELSKIRMSYIREC